MENYITCSKQETVDLGKALAQKLKKQDIIFFTGGLGMGKTAFCQGLCDGLDISAEVTSPTFTIVNEYMGKPLSLYHFDMYRVETEEQLYNIGFYDYLDYDGIIAIEWSENISGFFKDSTLVINFEMLDENTRRITIDRGEQQ